MMGKSIHATRPLSADVSASLSNSPTVPNFDRLARIYRWLEYLTFGPFLWRCRTHFLPQLLQCRNALILGDGDGRFTARLLHLNPRIRAHAVDGSLRMIEALGQAAAPHRNRLTTQIADLNYWSPPQSERYDLIVTHFFLDCLTTAEVAALASRLRPVLAPKACWLISDFAVPQSAFGRLIAAPLVALLYRAFRAITGLHSQSLPEYAKALTDSGWVLDREALHLRGLLVSQLWRHEESPQGLRSSTG